MIFLGNISGHDFIFHVGSWMDVAGQWREGILFPRWAEWANFGFGEPRFIFYPPLSWLTGATISSVLPWRMAPGAYIWLVLVLAGMSMWRLAREWLRGPHAIVAAALYAVNPYQLVIVYYRSAFGELLAAAILPLLIWATLRVVSGEWRRSPLLALVFAAVWLSNAPAAVIATYSIALVAVIGCVRKRSLKPLISSAVAMTAGFGLAAFYIVPAAWEQKWIQIASAVNDTYRPSANFLFTRANEPDFVAFNWKVSWVAVELIAVTAVGVLATFRRRKEFALAWWALAILALIATGMMLPPSLWLWRTLPKMWFIQFPWRWLDVTGVAFAFFVALLIATLPNRAAARSVAAVIFAGIGVAGAAMAHDAPWDSSDLPNIARQIQSGRGYDGSDEYTPVGCDRYQFPGNPDDDERPPGVSPNPAPRVAKLDVDGDEIVPASGVRAHAEVWSADRRFLTTDSATAVTLALRLVDYPAWTLEVNGQPARIETRAETRQILVPLPAGENRIELRFRRTPDREIGDALSATTALVVAVVAWAWRRRGVRRSA